MCRSEHPLPEEQRKKIALFTNVQPRAVIPLQDIDSIYRIPLVLHEYHVDDIVAELLQIECPAADLSRWRWVVDAEKSPTAEVTVAMVGKYINLLDAYKSLNESLIHAGIHTSTRVRVRYVDSEDLEEGGDLGALEGVDAVLVPGGFGARGVEGKIAAVRYARENRIPYLGICLGMQIAVVEFARNAVGLAGANSTEFDRHTTHPVVGLVSEWTDREGKRERREEGGDLGGTMRLGGQEARLVRGSAAHEIYGREIIVERHRHRYEVNNNYLDQLQRAGLRVSGWSSDDALVEVVEVEGHPWFVATQFHPEFTSSPLDGHPLFSAFVRAARTHRAGVHDASSLSLSAADRG